jgi:ATP-dependent DNA helicase RecG
MQLAEIKNLICKMSPEELRRLFAESSRLFADEELLFNSKQTDLDVHTFYEFLQKDNPLVWDDLENGKLELTTVLENLELLRDDHLTLAGNLIFGKLPQKHSPSFYVDCVHFNGDDIAGLDFIAKTTVKGTLSSQFENTMNFIRSNLKRVPLAEGFNAQTRLELDELAISELLVNEHHFGLMLEL